MADEVCLLLVYPDRKDKDSLRDLFTELRDRIAAFGGEMKLLHPDASTMALLVAGQSVQKLSDAIAPVIGNEGRWFVTVLTSDYWHFGLSAADAFLRHRLPTRGTPRR